MRYPKKSCGGCNPQKVDAKLIQLMDAVFAKKAIGKMTTKDWVCICVLYFPQESVYLPFYSLCLPPRECVAVNGPLCYANRT